MSNLWSDLINILTGLIDITINVDIIGIFNQDAVAKINIPNFEFFSINQFVEGEKLQDTLLIFLPKKENKDKVRKKGWEKEEAEYVKEYLIGGGNVVIVFPLEQEYLDKFLTFGQTFGFSSVLNLKEKLLHVNPNLLIFNQNKEGKLVEAKRFVKSYIHFLTDQKAEVIMEGNFLPVLMILPIEKGSLVLYGLGEESFWNEDVEAILSYLNGDHDQFFQKINYSIEFFKAILKNHPRPDILKNKFISNMVKIKSISDILKLKDEEFRIEALKLLDFDKFEDFFQNLKGKKIEQAYVNLKNTLNELDLKNVVTILEKFFMKKISERKITYKHLIEMFEKGLLPPEAAHLVVFFADPISPHDFRNFRDSIKKLIKWNESMKIFDENELKNLLWEKLQEEDEKIRIWQEKQKAIKQEEEEKKRRIEKEREIQLKKLEKEAIEKKVLEEKKKFEEEQQRIKEKELMEQRRKEREKEYKARHSKRVEKEKVKEASLKSQRKKRLSLKMILERKKQEKIEHLAHQKKLLLEIEQLKTEKFKAEEEKKKIEGEYQKLLEERKIRSKKYRKEKEQERIKATKELEEKVSQRFEQLKEKVTPIPVSKATTKIVTKATPDIPITDEMRELIEIVFNPLEFLIDLRESDEILRMMDKSSEKPEETIFDFITFAFNPIEHLEMRRKLDELEDLLEDED